MHRLSEEEPTNMSTRETVALFQSLYENRECMAAVTDVTFNAC